jgi:hypothetical protein
MGIFQWMMAFIIIVFALYIFFPLTLMLIFPSPRSYFEKNPDKIISKKHQDAVRELTGKIESLGFIKRKLPRPYGRGFSLFQTSFALHLVSLVLQCISPSLLHLSLPLIQNTPPTTLHLFPNTPFLDTGIFASTPLLYSV